MNAYQFASDSPWLAFFLVAVLAQAAIYCVKYVAVCFRGWPPPDEEDK